MDNEIKKAVEVLRTGGNILYPTDTIWGIGCDATNQAAADKVLTIKKRSEFQGMIILVNSIAMLNKYISKYSLYSWLLNLYGNQSITFIYPASKGIAKNVAAKDGSIAIRITTDSFCKKLLEKLDKPIVSTSANKSGFGRPNCFNEIDSIILDKVDYVVNLRQDEKNNPKPSTIIRVDNKGLVTTIRK